MSDRVLPALRKVGRVALFGGAVRDVARLGADQFRSDLDFVLYNGDREQFDDLVEKFEAEPNKFGGYRLGFKRWRVDVWMLEDTWARTAKLRVVDEVDDLLDCTFFDWDAILFLEDTGQILCRPEYFHRLRLGVMDANLIINPNPLGSLVRALRRAVVWEVFFGEKLSDFVGRSIQQFEWREVLELEKRAFIQPVLGGLEPESIVKGLEVRFLVDDIMATDPMGRAQRQLPLHLQRVGVVHRRAYHPKPS